MDKLVESVEQAEDLEAFAIVRRQLVNQSVALVMDAKTVPDLVEVLKQCALATSQPDSGNTLIWIDCNMSGETMTAPSIRKPRF